MNKISFWEFVHENLQADGPMMLLVVVESGGSSPGKPGFKMAVTVDGRIHGTIGGGIMEKELVDKAVKFLARGMGRPQLLKLLHHEGGVGKRSGMICSGWQQLAMLPLDGNDCDAVGSLIFALKRNRPGRLKFSPGGMEFQPRRKPAAAIAFASKSVEEWLYQEEAGQRPTVTIIGGGHVGLALSRVMADLNFHIVVLDDRTRVATMAANTYAQEKQVISYRSIGKHVSDGNQSYVVIMTFGHQADELVLAQLVGKKLRYLGLMGSPAGLPINSHTPEEIAISIAAEIIQVKNQPR
jgi:xanthine dehydrogenase accessory factor